MKNVWNLKNQIHWGKKKNVTSCVGKVKNSHIRINPGNRIPMGILLLSHVPAPCICITRTRIYYYDH